MKKLILPLLALLLPMPAFSQTPTGQAEISVEIADLERKLQATKEVEEHVTIPCIEETGRQGIGEEYASLVEFLALAMQSTSSTINRSRDMELHEIASTVLEMTEGMANFTITFVAGFRMNEAERMAVYESVLSSCFRVGVQAFRNAP